MQTERQTKDVADGVTFRNYTSRAWRNKISLIYFRRIGSERDRNCTYSWTRAYEVHEIITYTS